MINKTEQQVMENWDKNISEPLVSICCITYNHEKYISEALDSFLMQETDFPFEIIVDDDCSTDNTSRVIKEYTNKFTNIIKPNLRSKNVGMMKNFLENAKRAKGKYIAFCEGDDYWIETDKIKYQYKKMEDNPEIYLSFHSAYELLKKKKGNLISKHKEENFIFSTKDIILNSGNFCPTASIMINKNIVKLLPTWIELHAPTGDYYLQIFSSINGGALYLNKPMSIYRIEHTGSWTDSQKNIDKALSWIIKTNDCLEYLKDDLDEKYQEILNYKIRDNITKFINLNDVDIKTTFYLLSKYSKYMSLKNKLALIKYINFKKLFLKFRGKNG